MYSLSTLRRRAHKIGYHVSKGFQHYLCGGAVAYDYAGERTVGYSILDLSVNSYVWGSYNSIFDNQFDIEDVEEFLKEQYEMLGLTW